MIQVPFGTALVSRIEPGMPAAAYKTYGWSMPLRTHWRKATCEETGCDHYASGWVSTFDLGTDLGQRQYHYCTHDRTRRFTEQRVSLTLVKLIYAPGSTCFRRDEHRIPLARPGRFYVSGGDFRGNPRGIPARVHHSAADWCEDFAEHQDKLAAAIERG